MSKFSNADLTRWKKEINPAPIITHRVPLQRENAEWVGTCPPCFHDAIVGHPDKTPSFKVYRLDDGVWGYKCFGCGAAGNVFQFVQAFDGISFTAAVKKVLEEAGVSGWHEGEVQADPEMPEREHKEPVTFSLAVYDPAIQALEHAPAAQEWLAKRGISMNVARKFCLGFVQSAEAITPSNLWMKDGWVLFPTLSAGGQTITAVKYRSLIAKKAKMKNGQENSGILRAPNTSTSMFNLLTADLTGDVWVCEGEPDTLVMAQAGLQAVGFPSASYNPTDAERDLLSTAKRRFLAGDNDAAGAKTMAALQKSLSAAETYVIKWPNNRKDANDVLTNECGNDPKNFKALVEELRTRATQTEPLVVSRKASTIPPKEIKWLWPGKIPFGKLALFSGNPDNGKSIVSTSIAAICTTGGKFPETLVPCQPCDVLMLTGEDDADDTTVPRLMAAGADLTRIELPELVRPAQQKTREIQLDMDIPAIERMLVANRNIKLITIDPISNYLGKVSMVAEQDVRTLILMPLKRLAEKYGVAIVIVMHLNKKADLDAINRVGGAMAFIGVCRCSWLFARNVEDETDDDAAEEKPDTFSMLRIKNNLTKSSRSGLSYSVQVRDVNIEGKKVKEPYVVWGKAITGSADDALESRNHRQAKESAGDRPSPKMQEATNFLMDALQDGEPRPQNPLIKEAKERDNIKPDTLKAAYRTLVDTGIAKRAWKVTADEGYLWKLIPMNAGSPDPVVPQQSELVVA